MILSMSKEFGVPLSDEELKMLKSSSNTLNRKESNNKLSYIIKNEDNAAKHVDFNSSADSGIKNSYNSIHDNQYNENIHVPTSSRNWTPIDNINHAYLEKRRQKEDEQKDENVKKNYLTENINSIYDISQKNK